MFYIFLFLALLGTGVGLFPIPEDIIVLSAGVGIFEEVGIPVIVSAIIVIGILISDSIIFGLGRKYGMKILDFKIFSFILPRARVEKIQGVINGHVGKIVFGGRFVSGFRPVVLFSAGMSNYPFWSFLINDFLASLIYTPLLLFLGYRFSYDLDKLIHDMRRIYHAIEIVIILIIVGWFLLKFSKKIFNNKPV